MVKATGYRNNVLIVDLARRDVVVRPLDESILEDYLGGRGLAMRLLFDLAPTNVNPLHPDNPLIFATGPCAGTLVPASSRGSVAAKSPLTGLLGSGNTGSIFSLGLKGAGIDALVVTGSSEVPVYVAVRPGAVDIVECPELWGQDTLAVTRHLRQRIGRTDAGIGCIGPAGENQVPVATIIFDASRSAGRGGLGAVMGAKKLKAVVTWGDEPVSVAKPGELFEYCLDYVAELKREDYYLRYASQGTAVITQPMHDAGWGLVKNGREGLLPGISALSPDSIKERWRVRQYACPTCPMPCGQLYAAVSGSQSAWGRGSAGASVIMGFGPRCGVTDLTSIARAYAAANRLGIDLISANAIAAFAFECYETGLLSSDDADGLDLRFGNGEVIVDLLEHIALSSGIGALLGQGVREAAKVIGGGSDQFAPHVKGMEMMETEPRGLWSWALMFAVSSRGADHARAYDVTEIMQLADKDLLTAAGTTGVRDPSSIAGRGRSVSFFENIRALADSLEICRFVARGRLGFAEALLPFVHFVTGRDMDAGGLEATGERIVNLERLYNLREGLRPSDDNLPERYLNEPLDGGPAAGRVVPLGPMIAEYYHERGWDPETGAPSAKTLERLGLTSPANR